jgi:hypothetical protein
LLRPSPDDESYGGPPEIEAGETEIQTVVGVVRVDVSEVAQVAAKPDVIAEVDIGAGSEVEREVVSLVLMSWMTLKSRGGRVQRARRRQESKLTPAPS